LCHCQTLNDGISVFVGVKTKTPMVLWIDLLGRAVRGVTSTALDDTGFRTYFTFEDDRLALEVNVAVAFTCVGTRGNYDGIAVIGVIDGRLNSQAL